MELRQQMDHGASLVFLAWLHHVSISHALFYMFLFLAVDSRDSKQLLMDPNSIMNEKKSLVMIATYSNYKNCVYFVLRRYFLRFIM